MTERPYSRYTRAKTWAALYSQHINAGYALVPWSTTNNSIDVIRCDNPEEALKQTQDLLAQEADLLNFYEHKQTPDCAPKILATAIATKKLRSAIVLARSSDYHVYHLADHAEFRLVVCGIHDSYLHIPVWETRSNRRYKPRETAVSLSSPEFAQMRRSQFGHNILLGALIHGDATALSFLNSLHSARTRSRIIAEVYTLQTTRYRGRPLAFLTDAERQEIGSKISEGLRRYHERRRQS